MTIWNLGSMLRMNGFIKKNLALLLLPVILLAWMGTAPAARAEASQTEDENEQKGLSRLLEIWDKQGKEFIFTTENKGDPFMPAVTSESVEKANVLSGKALTPLQKMDLSTIKLVAVIISGKESMALVEDTTQMGYIVRVGTYMGTNNGRVVGIYPAETGMVKEVREIVHPARIEVKETIQTYLGTTKARVVIIPLKGEEK